MLCDFQGYRRGVIDDAVLLGCGGLSLRVSRRFESEVLSSRKMYTQQRSVKSLETVRTEIHRWLLEVQYSH